MGGYESVVIDRFGGVTSDYRAGPGRLITGASDVVLGKGGHSIRARLGFDNHTSSAAAAAYRQLYAHSDSILLARRTTTMAAINTSGAEATTTTVSSSNFVHSTRFGTPSASYSYIADGSTALIRYDGTNFASGATSATVDGVGSKAMPKGKFLAVTGSSNRLVVAGTASSGGPNGATSSGSHVWFSDAGSGETWTSTNYVQLDPGDGESITGCVTWRGQVFVFKQTKLYIFYSETTSSTGTPVFNYRSVNLGPRAEVVAPTSTFGNASIASGPEGVYYVGPNGVWVTTGDVPFSVTDEPFADLVYDPSPSRGTTTGYFSAVKGLHCHLGRIYVQLQTSGSVGVQLVYDLAENGWTSWTAPVAGFQTWRKSGGEPLLVSAALGSNDVVKWSNATDGVYTDDNGTAITAPFFKLSWWDLGLPGEKVIREVEVWGGGTVTLRLDSDFASSATTSSVALGSATTAELSTRGFARVSARGNYFSLFVTGSSYFRIDRIIFHLREAKNVGAKSS